MPDVNAVIAAELAKLRAAYLQRLPQELAELERLTADLSGSDADLPLLRELHHRVHKLAGSGGTFGLGTMSIQACATEQKLNAWLSGLIDAPFTERVEMLKMELAMLRASAECGESGTPPAMTAAVAGDDAVPRIWLIEDELAAGDELARLLEQFGYAVQHFGGVGDAERAALDERPDALIMSATFAAADAAGSIPATSPALRQLNCPLLFISAQGDFPARARAAQLGAAGFMVKPLDVPRLVDRLERIFEQRRAAPYRVLIVDDDVDLSEHFRLTLIGAGMEADVLNRPEDIVERVSAFRPELVLLDVHMPGYSGPELAAVIRQFDEWLGLPIVYLSAEADLDKQLQALGRGADDFITKPISAAQLAAAVRVRAVRSRQLGDLMSKDSLTGLLKHARIKEEVDVELVRARRSGKPISVAMIDIDHFKSVNDTYGHAVGDRVIRAVAHLLRQRLRKSDQIGRYGGEEFVAVLPECETDTAQKVLDDIRIRFSALRFRHDNQEFACTLSAGIACSSSEPEGSGNALLVAADTALYAAKHGGRNRVVVVTGDTAA
jgi:diguanylate cyclase (GGDEF)-like protein